jgi:transposase
MTRFVGLDLGLKGKHRAAVLDDAKVRGKPFTVEVSHEGFEALLQRAQEDAEGPVTFVFEPTGLAWLVVGAVAAAAGHRVVVGKPQKLSALRDFYSKHTKTDSVDAATVARLPVLDPDGVHSMRVPTSEETTLRRLVLRRDRLAREIGDHKRRVHALMVLANPSLMAALGQEAFTRAKTEFLRQHVDPAPVAAMGREALARFLAQYTKGSVDPETVTAIYESCQRAADLYKGLRAAGRLPFDYAAIQEEIAYELDEIVRKEADVDRLEPKIKQVYRCFDPDETLMQLRGVGPTIAAAIEAMVGNVMRFPNCRKFIGYTGLCPRRNQSGSSDPAMPITKCGQRLLKKYLYLAADVARQWDPDFAAYYARRYAQGDHHNHIVIALARKMACRVYALLKKRELARSHVEGSSPAPAPRYVLRDAAGNELSKKAARALIVTKFTRSIVAPERAVRDRVRKRGKVEAPSAANVSGRPKDATAPATKPPSEPVPLSQLLENQFHGLLRCR